MHAPEYASNPHYTPEDWDEVCDNPELTDEELAQLRPASEVLPPELYAALTKRTRGPQKAPTKRLVSLRLDRDVVEPSRRRDRAGRRASTAPCARPWTGRAGSGRTAEWMRRIARPVIPGLAEGESPEPMNMTGAGKSGPVPLRSEPLVLMGSGLAASQRPGMTAAGAARPTERASTLQHRCHRHMVGGARPSRGSRASSRPSGACRRGRARPRCGRAAGPLSAAAQSGAR